MKYSKHIYKNYFISAHLFKIHALTMEKCFEGYKIQIALDYKYMLLSLILSALSGMFHVLCRINPGQTQIVHVSTPLLVGVKFLTKMLNHQTSSWFANIRLPCRCIYMHTAVGIKNSVLSKFKSHIKV